MQKLCMNNEHESLYMALCGELSAIEQDHEKTVQYHERAWIKPRAVTAPCTAEMVHAIAVNRALLGNADKAAAWLALGEQADFVQHLCGIRITLVKAWLDILAVDGIASGVRFVEIEDAIFNIQAPELQIEMLELLARAEVRGIYAPARIKSWNDYFRSVRPLMLCPKFRRDFWLGLSRVKHEATRLDLDAGARARLLQRSTWAKDWGNRAVERRDCFRRDPQ
ncbi:hypothetical protein B5K08_23905 [Rhizobium leguminosarum bv. trifolii]|uniref:Uncharacterized protein n=2 Tax=Rhizobium leguminosarum TaxID=384 RepID=A0A3E1B620_RHILT|nr:hypothetical protein B5K08_23905 [Rhizobium leguminosarum bv. trifolii]RFB86633.1 hypothetical protein B5K10_23890 [Rhizobium leguminosarum bv. trifolii]